jgi:hypothetical protein
VPFMQNHQQNGAFAGMWILGAGVIGLFGNVTSIVGVTMVLACGLVPPMLLILQMLRWSPPVQAVRVDQANP